MSRLTRWWRRRRRAREAERRRRLEEEAERAPAPDGLAIPPPALRTRVAGRPALSHYLDSGKRLADDVVSRFREAGVDPAAFRRLADVGCGCGRVFRRLARLIPSARLHGLDVDREAVAWCREHLGSLGSFDVVPHRPPTALPTGAFDALVAISVLTHLPPDMQREWTAEWARLVEPGGHVLFSVAHEEERHKHESILRLVSEENGSSYHYLGPQEGHPDWYQVAFHSEAAARALLDPHFEVLRVQPRGIFDLQRSLVARRR